MRSANGYILRQVRVTSGMTDRAVASWRVPATSAFAPSEWDRKTASNGLPQAIWTSFTIWLKAGSVSCSHRKVFVWSMVRSSEALGWIPTKTLADPRFQSHPGMNLPEHRVSALWYPGITRF